MRTIEVPACYFANGAKGIDRQNAKTFYVFPNNLVKLTPRKVKRMEKGGMLLITIT